MDVLETIKIFKRVAEAGSFSAVAREFGTNQSTISRAIASLEESLGVLLFRRSTRNLKLTEEGRLLLAASQDVLTRVDEMFAAVRKEKTALKGKLRVAASLALGRLLICPIIETFSEIHPEINFEFILSDGYADLVEENIDVAIRMGNLPDSSLRADRIGTSRLRMYAGKNYLKKFGVPRTIEDLHNHRLLFFTRRAIRPQWDLVDLRGNKVEFQFKPYLATDGIDMLREAVIQDLGISIIPSWMMLRPELQGKVVKVLEQHTKIDFPMYAVTVEVKNYSSKQKAFIDFLKAKFDAIAAISSRS